MMAPVAVTGTAAIVGPGDAAADGAAAPLASDGPLPASPFGDMLSRAGHDLRAEDPTADPPDHEHRTATHHGVDQTPDAVQTADTSLIPLPISQPAPLPPPTLPTVDSQGRDGARYGDAPGSMPSPQSGAALRTGPVERPELAVARATRGAATALDQQIMPAPSTASGDAGSPTADAIRTGVAQDRVPRLTPVTVSPTAPPTAPPAPPSGAVAQSTSGPRPDTGMPARHGEPGLSAAYTPAHDHPGAAPIVPAPPVDRPLPEHVPIAARAGDAQEQTPHRRDIRRIPDSSPLAGSADIGGGDGAPSIQEPISTAQQVHITALPAWQSTDGPIVGTMPPSPPPPTRTLDSVPHLGPAAPERSSTAPAGPARQAAPVVADIFQDQQRSSAAQTAPPAVPGHRVLPDFQVTPPPAPATRLDAAVPGQPAGDMPHAAAPVPQETRVGATAPQRAAQPPAAPGSAPVPRGTSRQHDAYRATVPALRVSSPPPDPKPLAPMNDAGAVREATERRDAPPATLEGGRAGAAQTQVRVTSQSSVTGPIQGQPMDHAAGSTGGPQPHTAGSMPSTSSPGAGRTSGSSTPYSWPRAAAVSPPLQPVVADPLPQPPIGPAPGAPVSEAAGAPGAERRPFIPASSIRDTTPAAAAREQGPVPIGRIAPTRQIERPGDGQSMVVDGGRRPWQAAPIIPDRQRSDPAAPSAASPATDSATLARIQAAPWPVGRNAPMPAGGLPAAPDGAGRPARHTEPGTAASIPGPTPAEQPMQAGGTPIQSPLLAVAQEAQTSRRAFAPAQGRVTSPRPAPGIGPAATAREDGPRLGAGPARRVDSAPTPDPAPEGGSRRQTHLQDAGSQEGWSHAHWQAPSTIPMIGAAGGDHAGQPPGSVKGTQHETQRQLAAGREILAPVVQGVVVRHATLQVGGAGSSFRAVLTPKTLGEVTVHVHRDAAGLQVTLVPRQAATHQLLEHHLPDLIAQLQAGDTGPVRASVTAANAPAAGAPSQSAGGMPVPTAQPGGMQFSPQAGAGHDGGRQPEPTWSRDGMPGNGRPSGAATGSGARARTGARFSTGTARIDLQA